MPRKSGNTYAEKATKDQRISPSLTNPRRMLGGHVSRKIMRCIRNNDCPPFEPIEDDDDFEPAPLVVTPDIGFQIHVTSSLKKIVEEHLDEIVESIKEQISSDYSNAEVFSSISEVSGDPLLVSIGVWVSPGSASDEALKSGLEALDLLGNAPGLNAIGLFLSSSYIKRQTQHEWNAMGKRFNRDGKEDEDGSVHLTGLTVKLERIASLNRVTTTVTGFDDTTIPDVDFTMTFTDTLSISGDTDGSGIINCNTQTDLEVHNDFFFLGTILGAIVGSIPLVLFFGIQAILTQGKEFEREEGGVGCAIAAGIPREILFPINFGYGKIEFFWDQLTITSAGLFVEGRWNLNVRQPDVNIIGPSSVTVRNLQTITRKYRIEPFDLRSDDGLEDLDIKWSNGLTAPEVPFKFRAEGPNGTTLSERISVRVLDADNLTAAAEKEVLIQIVDSGEPF